MRFVSTDFLSVGLYCYKEVHMFGFGVTELIIILVIIVVFFGASRLPKLGSGIGEAIKNFKKSISEPSEIDEKPKNNKKEVNTDDQENK